MKLLIKVVLKSGVIMEDIVEAEDGATREEVEKDVETVKNGISEGLREEIIGGLEIGNMVVNLQEIAAFEIKIVESI